MLDTPETRDEPARLQAGPGADVLTFRRAALARARMRGRLGSGAISREDIERSSEETRGADAEFEARAIMVAVTPTAQSCLSQESPMRPVDSRRSMAFVLEWSLFRLVGRCVAVRGVIVAGARRARAY